MRRKMKEMTGRVFHGSREQRENAEGQSTSMARKEMAD